MRRAVAATCLALGLGLSGSAAVAVAAPADTITDPPASSTVHLAVGESVTVRLTACVSCGDSWEVSLRPRASVVRTSGPRQVDQPHQPGVVGFPVWDEFTFTGRSGGTTTAVLKETGPGSSKALETKRLRFVVRGDLPSTGAPTGELALLGAAMVGAGWALTAGGRSRRTTAEA